MATFQGAEGAQATVPSKDLLFVVGEIYSFSIDGKVASSPAPKPPVLAPKPPLPPAIKPPILQPPKPVVPAPKPPFQPIVAPKKP